MPKKLAITQYPILFGPANTNIPNANTDISFLPCFLLELDMRSEACCAIRASQMVLTKH